MSIAENIARIKKELPVGVALVVVSKTHPVEIVQQAYDAGQRLFGENRVQELLEKYAAMPKDIQWHLIGHLQTNKVKMVVPFVSLIQSVDSMKLLQEIEKEAAKIQRTINCLLQIHVAMEETKSGFSLEEVVQLLKSNALLEFKHIRIRGVMTIATNTRDEAVLKKEFQSVKDIYDSFFELSGGALIPDICSFGMSSDYLLAAKEGSTMVRIGSRIFGERETVGNQNPSVL